MRRLGGVTAALLVLGAIGIVAILLAVYGVGCFQLRRPSQEPSGVVESPHSIQLETSVGSASPDAVPTPSGDRTAVAGTKTPIRIRGVVLDFPSDPKQAPVPAPGVEVHVEAGFEEASTPLRTGGDGRFAFEIEDPGRRPLKFEILAVGSAGQRQANAQVVVAEGKHEAVDVVLRRYPKGDLVGITVNTQDAPVPDVHLTFRFREATRETDSDSHGEFRIPDVESIEDLKASRPGYALLSSFTPNRIEQGGWETMRVVLAPTTPLAVRVVDGAGQGIPGLTVSVQVAEWERKLPKKFPLSREFRGSLRVQTREDGRATLDVWTSFRLSIAVEDGQQGRRLAQFDRELDGRLVRIPSTEGRPIVVATGESRELTAIIEKGPILHVSVVDELSKPVPKAFVSLEEEWNAANLGRSKADGQCDEAGRVVLELPPLAQGVKYRLTGTDRDPREYDRTGERTASLALDLSSGLPSEVVLVLRAGLKIAGHVVSADGKIVAARIYAFAEGDSAAVGPWGRYADTDKDGAFAIENLQSGTYDLWVRPEDPYGEVRMRDVRAGRDDVELRVPAVCPAHVTVEVDTHEDEPDQLIVLTTRSWRTSDRPVEIAMLPGDGTYSEAKGWPSSVAWIGYGVGGFEDELGVASFLSQPMKGNPMRLDLNEGTYWFGARGKDRDGRPLFPVGTGWVRITAGEYHLRFNLVPAVRIEGRLLGADVVDLAIGIVRHGELLDLDVGARSLMPSRPVRADGSFEFAAVPVGEGELWIGTSAELAAGKPSHRQPLTVDGKGVPFLEIPVR